MSHGSWVAARDGGPAPLAGSPPRASVTAARLSSALLACRNRGLTVIVESVLSLSELRCRPWAAAGPCPVNGHGESARRHAGRHSPSVVLAITSLRLFYVKAVAYRTSVSVSANKRT